MNTSTATEELTMTTIETRTSSNGWAYGVWNSDKNDWVRGSSGIIKFIADATGLKEATHFMSGMGRSTGYYVGFVSPQMR